MPVARQLKTGRERFVMAAKPRESGVVRTNAEVAAQLREMAIRLEMERIPFKPRAYEKAAFAVEALSEPIVETYAQGGVKSLEALPALGKSIAGKIAQFLTNGRIDDLEDRRTRFPVDVLGLSAIEGVGPRTIRALYEELGVRSVPDLERAVQKGKVHDLPHFGVKSERKIAEGIEFVRRSKGRRPLGAVLDQARIIEARLPGLPGVRYAAIAGSIRRHKETVGDADFLIAADDAARAMTAFMKMPEIARLESRGETKAHVVLRNGLGADLRVVKPESWGAALVYFTGSKDHNIALRQIAQAKRLKLSEYGLFRGRKSIAGKTEKEVYQALGLPWIPPEIREDRGEIEAAKAGRLPDLIDYGDVEGDLQVHTNWTDGANSIEQMVRAAGKLGRRYVAITDHTRDLAMTGGADEAKLREQIETVHRLGSIDGVRVLSGAEVNIRPDGTLDIADEVLSQLDVVGAAVHSRFDMPRAEMTRRIVRAMENPNVDILFHPTARSLGRRPAIDVDFPVIIEAALRTGTALEIDGQPERLDLEEDQARKAVAAGVKIVIDSDAHNVGELRYLDEYGIAEARRGWVKRSDVINALPAPDFLASLKGATRAVPAA
jgi:DNA polymerase (family X)